MKPQADTFRDTILNIQATCLPPLNVIIAIMNGILYIRIEYICYLEASISVKRYQMKKTGERSFYIIVCLQEN